MKEVGPVETEIAQAIENRMPMIHLITTEAMLVMIDHSIGAGVYKETVGGLHPGGRNIVVLNSSMHNDQYVVCFTPCFLNGIVLTDGVDGIGTTRMWGGYAEFMLCAVDDSDSLPMKLLV